MKFNSIRNRMMLTAAASLLSMIILVANQVYSDRMLIALHKERVLLLSLSNQLLQMRRAEKDLLMRHDPLYLTKISELSRRFNRDIDQIFNTVNAHDLPVRFAETITVEVAQYTRLLNEMALVLKELGDINQGGLLFDFNQQGAELTEQLQQDDGKVLTQFLSLRLLEQQYFQANALQEQGMPNPLLNQRYLLMQGIIEQIQAVNTGGTQAQDLALMAKVEAYQQHFDKIVKQQSKLGNRHDLGLQKQFRDSAHQVENGLTSLNELLNPVIVKKEAQVKFISSIILLINILVLLFIIARNFHQFRRSFASFVQFFKTSKHQKTLLNVQEVTFNEFKELALLANEMIEARFNTEEALEQAKQKLTQTNQQLSAANRELKEFASLDPLTKIANRRQLDEVRALEWRRCLREQHPYSVVLIDVDYFKPYNDNYGHQQGDEALVQVAQALVATTKRASDLVARYGGEEFAVVLPNINLASARLMADKMISAVAALKIKHEFSAVASYITISAGVACAKPSQHSQPSGLFAEADKALYLAKSRGRNQSAQCHLDM